MARKIKHKVTQIHSELFDLYIQKWIEKLNLKDWRVIRDKRPSKYMAEIFDAETEHRLVKYRLGSDFGSTEVTTEALESTAIHELLHLLLHELLECACEEGTYTEKVMGLEHSVIVVLEALLLKLAKMEDVCGA